MLRLFTSIAVPKAVSKRLAEVRASLPGARWTDSDSYHLTLRFLGAVHEDQLDALVEQLGGISFLSFDVEIDGLDTFPGVRAPRVLHARVVPTTPLLALRKAVDRAVEPLGFEPDSKPFRPHITLARLKDVDPSDVRGIVRSNSVESAFAIDQFKLMASETHPEGARHHEVAAFSARRGP